MRPKKKLLFGTLLFFGVSAGLAVYMSYRKDMQAAYERISKGSKIINTACGPIQYATLGEGAPVLVLHGTSGGWDQGISAAKELGAHGFQLIAPSRFGYLGTPLPDDASPAAEADAWIDFLDALQIQRVAVISYSAGAAPAMQLALRHPDRISAEVFFVPGSGGICPECVDAGTNPPRALLDGLYRFDFPMWTILKLFPKFAHSLVATPEATVSDLTPGGKMELAEAIRGMLPVRPRRLGVLNESNTQGTQIQYPLEDVTTATLFISAADDLYKTLAVAKKAAQIIPNAELLEFPSGGHLLLERGDEIWPAVAEFFEDHGAGPR